ncbi:MAG: MBL fold metallo-hydrolase [Syntrophomonas sp.]
MPNEILPSIFQLTIPLPRNPLKSLNAYLIRGDSRHLLIDTGFDWKECQEALLAGLEQLKVDLSDIDFFITHVHGDHSGLVYKLAGEESKVYASKTDACILRDTMTPEYWQKTDRLFIMHGFPRVGSREPGSRVQGYISGSEVNFSFVNEGDVIEIGPYRLSCIMTPGHSPGHVCLYEADKKLLFSGDHILNDISPNITLWLEMEDPLGEYLQSLDLVYGLDIGLVLPGHRSLIKDHRKRILEIKQHHQARLAEILEILAKGDLLKAYEIASFMNWDLSYESWEEFPPFQKWFATGEAVAHLEHLVQLNKIGKIQTDEHLLYGINI